MIEHTTTAHLDEAGARLVNGRRLYVVAAVLTSSIAHERIVAVLTELQETNLPLHFYTERGDRRVTVAKALAEVDLHGAILVTTSSSNVGQEQARARILGELLPRLEHVEKVRRAILESRSGGDKHDRRTLDRLRRARRVAELRIDHETKMSPLLWVADWVASSYVAAHHHNEREPWEILTDSHPIEVTSMPPR